MQQDQAKQAAPGIKKEKMKNVEALAVNTAACHGVLREYRQLQKRSGTADSKSDSWLMELGDWILDCIGAKEDEQSFWRGWEAEQMPEGKGEIEKLGHMCRTSAQEHNKKCETGEISKESSMMYNCYAKALKRPRDIELVTYDSHLDDKTDDLRASEKVFELHFKSPLRSLLLEYAKELRSSKRLVIADIGSGNGRVLEFAAEVMKEANCEFRLIAIDPSERAQELCKERLVGRQPSEVVVTGATLEDVCEGRARELTELRSDEELLILMKGVLHDRSIAWDEEGPEIGEGVYRDKDWNRISKERIIKDLTLRLNGLRRYQERSRLIIMESHLVSKDWTRRLLKVTPLMPAYIGHAITAQYLISANDHLQGIKACKWGIKKFERLCQLDTEEAIMTITSLE